MTVRAVVVVMALAAAPATGQRPPTPQSREAFVMGTRVVLTTYADTRARGLARLEQMLEVIERTEAELSTWRPTSEISRLNAAAGGEPQHLSSAMCRLFSDLDRQVIATGGTFDPGIGSLTAAWDLHGRGRIPSERELTTARLRGGWRMTGLDLQRCTLSLSGGASIDVGAFGKGEALDRVRSEVANGGPWLIDLGGQVAVSGVPPGEGGWQVTIAHPHIRTRPVLTVNMREGSLATSAGSERDLRVRGKRVGHILDPRTGAPASFNGSVSVWSDRALTADALSTALFVMGPDEGIRWADSHDVAALFLQAGADGVVHPRASTAFSRRFDVVGRSR